MKDKERIKGIVEAILFTMGESVALSRLAEVLEVEEEALKDLLEEMKGDYAGKDRGICLIEVYDGYRSEGILLSTASTRADNVRSAVPI